MRISEIFYSLQGEGFLAGTPGVFVRVAGCTLRCRWCDTKYAWDRQAGAHYTIEKIIHTIENWSSRYVVITGGEPMTGNDASVGSELPKLLRELKTRAMHVTIETAGMAFVPGLPCDLMSISPKLSNSVPTDSDLVCVHEDSRLDVAILRELIDNYQYQLKFVVDSEDDLTEIQQTIGEIGNVDSRKVILMPQAATRDELLAKSPMVADLCKLTGFAFGQRLQLLLWNNQRGM